MIQQRIKASAFQLRFAPLLSVFLRVLEPCLAVSQSQLNHPLERGQPFRDNDREELKSALATAQDSLAVQILLEACLQSNVDIMFELVWPIPEERYDDVITHLRHNFFPDEPLNSSVGLCPSPGQPHKQLEDHALYTLADGISVMAVNGDKEVVGVILNGVLREGDLEKALVKLESIDDDKFKVIFGQLYRLNLELDMFNKFQVDRIFEARILSVDKAYRSLGLAHKLMAKCEEVAADKGFKMIKEDSTGLFSQKLLAKLGHQTMSEINYEDIKDEDGEIIFKTPPPHTSLKVMYKIVGK